VTDGPDIGGRSRRFQAAVIVLTMLALLAGALAAASLSDSGSLIDIDPGGDGGGNVNGSGTVDGDGSGSGGWELPGFLVDILDWVGASGEPGDGEPAAIPQPPYDITLDPEPTPGGEVLVTVEKNSTPVPFALVAFEGNPVGRANASGQLVARVPYTDELTVSAAPPRPNGGGTLEPPRLDSGRSPESPRLDSGRSPESPRLDSGGPAAASHLDSGGPAAASHLDSGGTLEPPRLDSGELVGASSRGALGTGAASTQADDEENSSVTYEVRTDVTARVDGVALPGETATVQFTVAGAPLPFVDVTRDGEQVAVTDGNGTAAVEMPADATPGGSVPVSLARDEFAGAADIEVGEVTASVETGLLAVPLTGATVEVTAVDSTSEEPLPDAAVTVTDGGEEVAAGATDADGGLSFTLPWTNSVTATATTGHGSVSATAEGLFLQFAGAVVALVLPVAGVAVWLTRNPATRRRARERLVAGLLTAGALLESAGLRLAAFLEQLPVRDAVARLWDGLTAAPGWLWRGLDRVAARARTLLGGIRGYAREGAWLAFALAGPRWLLGRLRAGLSWLLGQTTRPSGAEDDTGQVTGESATGERGATTAPGPGPPQSAYERLRRYWQLLVRRVVGRGRARTKTPTEIERRAVDRGLPPGAVRRLRRAFQDVEYGPDDAEERVDEAASAHERLQEGDSESNT
jgi:hypothetical protein